MAIDITRDKIALEHFKGEDGGVIRLNYDSQTPSATTILDKNGTPTTGTLPSANTFEVSESISLVGSTSIKRDDTIKSAIKKMATVINSVEGIEQLNRYSGMMYIPTITHNAIAKTITIGESEASIYAEGFNGNPTKYVVPPKTFPYSHDGSTASNDIDWIIYAHVVNGTAVYDVGDWIDALAPQYMDDIIPVYRVWVDAENNMHSADFDSLGVALSEKLAKRVMEVDYYKRANNTGLMLSANASTVYISEGVVYAGVVRQPLSEFSGLLNSFTLIEDLGTGNYQQSTITTYNNTHYQGESGLVSLSPNKWTVNWVYRSVGDDVAAFIYLGGQEYNNLANAKEAIPPMTPAILSGHCIRVGRIIVQRGATTNLFVQSEFSTVYEGGTASVAHTDTTNKNGEAEYQHMTAAESTIMDNLQGGVRLFDDGWSMVKVEQGSQYESIEYLITSWGDHFRGYGTTTSVYPIVQKSIDGGQTWVTVIPAPGGAERVMSIRETSLGLIVTYGSNAAGDGKYCYSTNRGESWSNMQVSYSNAYSMFVLADLNGKLYFTEVNSSSAHSVVYITALGGGYIPCTFPADTGRAVGGLLNNGSEYIVFGSINNSTIPQVWSGVNGVDFVFDSVKTAAITAGCPTITTLHGGITTTPGNGTLGGAFTDFGNYYIGGSTNTSMGSRDFFVIELNFDWTVATIITKNPSGRTDKGPTSLSRIIKSKFTDRYFFAMSGAAGKTQIVYTDVPASEWLTASESEFKVIPFGGTIGGCNVTFESTGRLIAITTGAAGDADIYYSDKANGRISSFGNYARIAGGDDSCVAMTPEGIKFLSAGRMVPCSIGNFNSLADLLAYNTAKTAKGTSASVLLSTMAFEAKWIGKRWVSATPGMTLVYNASGVTLTAGTPVYLAGSTLSGEYYYTNIYKAQANAKSTCSNLALVISDVASGAIGVVANSGILSKLNLSQADGTILYLSATTAGTLTATEPMYPNFSCKMGVIKRGSSTTDGEFYINPDTDPSYATSVSTQSGGASYPLIMSEYADNFGSNTTWSANNYYSNICSVLFVPQNYLTVTGMQMFVRQVGIIYAARMGIYEVSPSSDMLIAQTEGRTSGFVAGVNSFALQTPNSIVLTPGVKYMLTLQISGNGFEVMRRTGLQTNSPNHFAKMQLNFGSNDFITGGLISTLQGSSTTYQPWIGLV